MKFLSIELENVFTYRHKIRVDLSSTTEKRNIVLIRGRNGVGKTSFLSAVKILFTGLDASEDREVGFPPATIPLNSYLLGSQTSNWMGLLNQSALRDAKARHTSITARIEAIFEFNGMKVIAERNWTSDGFKVDENVIVVAGGDRLAGEAANNFLQSMLPRDTVRFFFYDGDEIRSLAESLGRKWFDFDRLLGLSFLKVLQLELEEISKERARKSLSEANRIELNICEGALNRAKRELTASQDELLQLNERLARQNVDMTRLQSRRENLSEGASEFQRAELLQRRNETSKALEDLHEEIALEIPTWAPVLVNLNLVRNANQIVEDLITITGSASVALSNKIESKFPEWLSEPPVEVPQEYHSKIVAIFKRKILSLLESPSADGLFSKLSSGRIYELRNRLQTVAISGEEKKRVHFSKLREAVQKKLLLDQLEESLLRLEVSSQTKLGEYRLIVERAEELQRLISVDDQRKGQLNKNIADFEAEIVTRAKKLSSLETALARGRADAKEATGIATFARTIDEIRLELREAVREDVSIGLNRRFMQLISGTTPITKIILDENYNTSYEGINKAFLGGASLSSGTRQLVATALVWALKDRSGLDMPVIIDTPLGRIDRENQTSLLTQYYPEISRQVIILPTTSEIDDKILESIQDNVAIGYEIKSDSSDLGPELTTIFTGSDKNV